MEIFLCRYTSVDIHCYTASGKEEQQNVVDKQASDGSTQSSSSEKSKRLLKASERRPSSKLQSAISRNRDQEQCASI